MQISAKATFLGFVQALDPHTGVLEMAGLKIALAHTGGALAGDVLQVDAALDDAGCWSGVIVSHLINPQSACAGGSVACSPQAATEPRMRTQAAATTPALTAARQPAPAGSMPAVSVAPAAVATAPVQPLPARAQTPPVRRFGVSSSAGQGAHPRVQPHAHAHPPRAATRPLFSPTAADEHVCY